MCAVRSTQVTFNNATIAVLVLDSMSLQWGIWSNENGDVPPTNILGGTQVQWQSESAGFMTGTQGSASYAISGDSNQLVTIEWDNPFKGDNNYSLAAPSGYQIQFCDSNFQNCQSTQGDYGTGNNAAIYVSLTEVPPSS
jgi:hypothetical protein